MMLRLTISSMTVLTLPMANSKIRFIALFSWFFSLNGLHQSLRLCTVTAFLYTPVASNGIIFLYYAQTYDLVSIVHQLVDQPL